jgi:hypothetical protein
VDVVMFQQHFDILAGSVGVQKADPKNASRCRW